MADKFQPILGEATNRASPTTAPMVDTSKGDLLSGAANLLQAGINFKDRLDQKEDKKALSDFEYALELERQRAGGLSGDDASQPEDPRLKGFRQQVSKNEARVKQGGSAQSTLVRQQALLKEFISNNPDLKSQALAITRIGGNLTPGEAALKQVQASQQSQADLQTFAKKELAKEADTFVFDSAGNFDLEATAAIGQRNRVLDRQLEDVKRKRELQEISDEQFDVDVSRNYISRFNDRVNASLTLNDKVGEQIKSAPEEQQKQYYQNTINSLRAGEVDRVYSYAADVGMSKQATDQTVALVNSRFDSLEELFVGTARQAEQAKNQLDLMQSKVGIDAINAAPMVARLNSTFGKENVGVWLTTGKYRIDQTPFIDAVSQELSGFFDNQQTTQPAIGSGYEPTPQTVTNHLKALEKPAVIDSLTQSEASQVYASSATMLKSMNNRDPSTLTPTNLNAWLADNMIFSKAVKQTTDQGDLLNAVDYYPDQWLALMNRAVQTPEVQEKAQIVAKETQTNVLRILSSLSTDTPIGPVDIVFNPDSGQAEFKVNDLALKTENEKRARGNLSLGKLTPDQAMATAIQKQGNYLTKLNRMLTFGERVSSFVDGSPSDPKTLRTLFAVNAGMKFSKPLERLTESLNVTTESETNDNTTSNTPSSNAGVPFYNPETGTWEN